MKPKRTYFQKLLLSETRYVSFGFDIKMIDLNELSNANFRKRIGTSSNFGKISFTAKTLRSRSKICGSHGEKERSTTGKKLDWGTKL